MRKKDKPISKKWILISFATAVVIYSLCGFLILPARDYLSSVDVVYAETVIPDILNYTSDLLEIGVIALFYASMICLLYKFGTGINLLIALFTAATVYKYAVNVLVTWLNQHSIPLLWYWDIVDVVFFTLLELLQLAVIYFIIKRIIGEYILRREAKTKFEGRGENGAVGIEEPYPYKGIFNLKNCILASVFVCAVATFAAKLLGPLVNDLISIISFGLPKDTETWLLMATQYISMALPGILMYFLIVGFTIPMLKQKGQD